MRLTLNELQVESYASQLNGQELTELKGGTGGLCAAAIQFYITTVGVPENNESAGVAFGHINCQEGVQTVTIYYPDGTSVTEVNNVHICGPL